MRSILAVLLLAVSVMAIGSLPPYNNTVIKDTIYVDSTSSSNSKVYWQDYGAMLSMTIEAYDDSTAGTANDSAKVQMDLYQVQYMSTGKVAIFVAPTDTLPDSLNIVDMSTTAAYTLGTDDRTDAQGNVVGYKYNTELDAAATGFGALLYHDMDRTDYSPGYMVKLTGLGNNQTRGTGSRWILHWVQSYGAKVTE